MERRNSLIIKVISGAGGTNHFHRGSAPLALRLRLRCHPLEKTAVFSKNLIELIQHFLNIK